MAGKQRLPRGALVVRAEGAISLGCALVCALKSGGREPIPPDARLRTDLSRRLRECQSTASERSRRWQRRRVVVGGVAARLQAAASGDSIHTRARPRTSHTHRPTRARVVARSRRVSIVIRRMDDEFVSRESSVTHTLTTTLDDCDRARRRAREGVRPCAPRAAPRHGVRELIRDRLRDLGLPRLEPKTDGAVRGRHKLPTQRAPDTKTRAANERRPTAG